MTDSNYDVIIATPLETIEDWFLHDLKLASSEFLSMQEEANKPADILPVDDDDADATVASSKGDYQGWIRLGGIEVNFSEQRKGSAIDSVEEALLGKIPEGHFRFPNDVKVLRDVEGPDRYYEGHSGASNYEYRPLSLLPEAFLPVINDVSFPLYTGLGLVLAVSGGGKTTFVRDFVLKSMNRRAADFSKLIPHVEPDLQDVSTATMIEQLISTSARVVVVDGFRPFVYSGSGAKAKGAISIDFFSNLTGLSVLLRDQGKSALVTLNMQTIDQEALDTMEMVVRGAISYCYVITDVDPRRGASVVGIFRQPWNGQPARYRHAMNVPASVVSSTAALGRRPGEPLFRHSFGDGEPMTLSDRIKESKVVDRLPYSLGPVRDGFRSDQPFK